MDCDTDVDESDDEKENVTNSFILKEVSGDLFGSSDSESLCHCVSRDLRLGKGIAKLFREKFGRIDELKSSGAGVGDIAVLKMKNRFIYNLVTKEVYSGKPTYDTLRKSLEKMRDHAKKHNVTKINMPRIGCGLDGLSWPAVRTLVNNVFRQTDIIITVYTLDQDTSDKQKTTIADMFKKEKKSKETETVIKSPDKNMVDVGFGHKTSKPLPDVFTDVKIHIYYRALLRRWEF